MISSKKIGLGSNYEFGVILGQISNLTQSMQIIYQNEALDISFSSWDKIFTFLEEIHKQGCTGGTVRWYRKGPSRWYRTVPPLYFEEWYIRFGSNHSYQVIRWKWIRWWHQILNPLTHFRFTGNFRFETFERQNINLFWPILA